MWRGECIPTNVNKDFDNTASIIHSNNIPSVHGTNNLTNLFWSVDTIYGVLNDKSADGFVRSRDDWHTQKFLSVTKRNTNHSQVTDDDCSKLKEIISTGELHYLFSEFPNKWQKPERSCTRFLFPRQAWNRSLKRSLYIVITAANRCALLRFLPGVLVDTQTFLGFRHYPRHRETFTPR